MQRHAHTGWHGGLAGVPWVAGLCLVLCTAGCPNSTSSDATRVIASIINVTPFEITVHVAGVVGDTAEIVDRTVAALDSTDVAFTCLDELALGNPLDPNVPAGVVDVNGTPVELTPFLLRQGTHFACGEIVEIIVSGDRADNLRMDVFALNLP